MFKDPSSSFFLLQSPWGLMYSQAEPFFASEPHDSLPSFYINDFFLENRKPWALLPQMEILETAHFKAAPQSPQSDNLFEESSESSFFQSFDEIKADLAHAVYEKIVPAVCFKSSKKGPSLSQFLASSSNSRGRMAYAYRIGNRSLMGLSPEILFSLNGLELESMALAGTAPIREAQNLLHSEKDLREHQFVVKTLESKLAELGQLKTNPIELLEIGPLCHLLTKFKLSLSKSISVNEIIAKLHPTPALGASPWNIKSQTRLKELRKKHGVYPEFGAPFGMVWGSKAFFLVAIRNILVTENATLLATGCGVIRESQKEKEWAELLLKRAAVAQSIGL